MTDKKKISPLMFLPPLIFAGLAVLFYIGVTRDDPNALPSTLIGREAPAMQLEPIGEMTLLKDAVLREPGVKLVNFWGTWCVACRQEHPQLLHMANELGLDIHGVNYDDTQARALAYLEREGNPFSTLGEDISGRTKIDWGVYGAPETFVVDGKGVIHLRYAGPITDKVLNDVILPAIQAASR
ncbi:cytochrome c biogenesis protein CcmG/thiol:disulfide interchange protein DsbE [Rhodovulum bhavnagarense]|uniref:Cytochrome c biogenesis protein CcmG/thiol:disulfide interchange protein DsbE n=1 Tax=Rhodovulum bhavnagarense TaxID=992286 RepID=A0A4R2RPX8_9RHOB|nr:DsbE family thiol:disulfide interchange protein [Rhodovulum bhavnagarense]TCP61891.1 cytochrome c biogenesis protein CcmG/thiol:disulfide interchange protein DsbE [Rhodovulum bhavnagarense]